MPGNTKLALVLRQPRADMWLTVRLALAGDDDDDDDLFYASLARLWAYGGCLKCSISLRLPGMYLTRRRPFYLCYNNVHLTDVQVQVCHLIHLSHLLLPLLPHNAD